jgi:hypothetical protein
MGMSEGDPYVSALELHEQFVQRVEREGRMMRIISMVTIVVSGVLALSYVSQLVVVPFVLGIKTQTVDLVDPALMAAEVLVAALALVWFYVGLRGYLFARRMSAQVKEIRRMQAGVAEKYGLEA